MSKETYKQKPKTQKTSIKWVKRAGMWCKTSWKNGKQVQEWFKDHPNG